MTPVSAVAAAVSGEARNVRAPLPWRPSKLRLLVLDDVLARRALVAVHRDAHRAARLAPVGARGAEDVGEALALGLRLHLLGAGHDHDAQAVGDAATLEERGRLAQVADAAVRAGADEDGVDAVAERAARRAAGPCRRAPSRACGGCFVGCVVRAAGRARRMPMPMPGFVPYVIDRLERRGVERDRLRRRSRPASEGSVAPVARPRRPRSAPVGACGRPATYSNVVSSGAMSPARAPPSMDMLQIVMRCSIESARMASPVYSKTWPVPPPMPMRLMRSRMMSFAVTPGCESPVDADLVGLRGALEEALGREDHLHLARADAEGERAERAVGGGVRVAADDRHARLRQAELGTDDMDDALAVRAERVERDPELLAVALSWSTWNAACWSRIGSERSWVGVLWSAVAIVRSGWRTLRPRRRRPSNACGLVTSWTRWRSMPRTVGAPASSWTTWRSQIFWTSVRGAGCDIIPRVAEALEAASGPTGCRTAADRGGSRRRLGSVAALQ